MFLGCSQVGWEMLQPPPPHLFYLDNYTMRGKELCYTCGFSWFINSMIFGVYLLCVMYTLWMVAPGTNYYKVHWV